jgi:hypothetical protein
MWSARFAAPSGTYSPRSGRRPYFGPRYFDVGSDTTQAARPANNGRGLLSRLSFIETLSTESLWPIRRSRTLFVQWYSERPLRQAATAAATLAFWPGCANGPNVCNAIEAFNASLKKLHRLVYEA